ncbi:MAG: NAD-dependent epimerase/dehydratase family protein, partial [Deltaproteobacteria bacterium]|nr:NAD-dependent epimerase/dehydratase family protein [Deltaproteobacteria bacterium]
IVVHLAARVHQMAEDATDPLYAYRQVNVEGTRNLAESAARAGVKRFVYLSSVKVNGEENAKAYTETHEPSPTDAYGISKMKGESALKTICEKSGMEFVIIRPPLVYGPEVKANFLALMRLVDCRIPLPLASVTNRRSFIYLGNLIDCIYNCMTHPAAAGQTYLVSDDKDVSTPGLIRLIATSLKKPVCLFPFPQAFLSIIGRLLGKENAIKRLLGSLTVDISKIKRELNWTPPFTIESGLLDTADWYKTK